MESQELVCGNVISPDQYYLTTNDVVLFYMVDV